MILFEFVSSWVNLAFVPYCQTFNQLRRRPPSNSVFISDVHIWKINILSVALKQDLKYFLFSWAGMKSPGEANQILELKISTRKRNLRSLETRAPRMQVTWIHATLKDCKESRWKYNCKYEHIHEEHIPIWGIQTVHYMKLCFIKVKHWCRCSVLLSWANFIR